MGRSARDVALGLAVAGTGRYVSDSADATRELGRLLAPLLREGDLVILTGDLGAGKTQMVKGVADGLSVTDEVTSPTFNILATHHGAGLDLYHFDLYRLEDADELGDAGVLDVAGVEGASLVEWGETFADELGDERVDITVSRVPGEGEGEPRRLVEVRARGARGEELARDLHDAVDSFSRGAAHGV